MGKDTWFSRTVAKMSSKARASRTPRGATSEREREGERAETRDRDAARARDGTTPVERESGTRKGKGEKMCVEDFEPLKLIGRGAFGARRREARRRRERRRAREYSGGGD